MESHEEGYLGHQPGGNLNAECSILGKTLISFWVESDFLRPVRKFPKRYLSWTEGWDIVRGVRAQSP